MTATRDGGWRGGYPSGSTPPSELRAPTTGAKRSGGGSRPRLLASEILPRETARRRAAEIGQAIAPLLDQALTDPVKHFHAMSDAQRLAVIGSFYVGYAALLEGNQE